MKITVSMRLENNQEGNTWYSNALEGDGETQLHIPRQLYLGMAKPEYITVTIDKDSENE